MQGLKVCLCIRENGDYWTSSCSCCLEKPVWQLLDEALASGLLGLYLVRHVSNKSVWSSAELLNGDMQESQLGGKAKSSLEKWKNCFLVNDTNTPLPCCSTKSILPAQNAMKNNNGRSLNFDWSNGLCFCGLPSPTLSTDGCFGPELNPDGHTQNRILGRCICD